MIAPKIQSNSKDLSSLDVQYSAYANTTDSRGIKDLKPLPKLIDIFTKHLSGEKDGPAFAPALFAGKRTKANLLARTMVVLDIERSKYQPDMKESVSENICIPPALSELQNLLSKKNTLAITHTSFSHETENPRYRVIFPIEAPHWFPDASDPLARNAAFKIDQIAVELIADEFSLRPFLDESKLVASSIFFYPRAKRENLLKAEAFWTNGDLIDFSAYYLRAEKIFILRQENEESSITKASQRIFNSGPQNRIADDINILFDTLRNKIGPMANVLCRYGYNQIAGTERWYPSDGDESTAGIILNHHDDGVERIYSFHANHLLSGDKLIFGRKTHDVIDVEIAHRFGVTEDAFKKGIKILVEESGLTFKSSFNERALNVEVNNKTIWPEPIDLFDDKPLPKFPMDVLTADERRYVQDVASALGVDFGPVVMAMLATVAAALDARTKLKMREKNDYHESKMMWVALIGSPASKKSPVLNTVKQPLQKLQDKENKRYLAAVKQYQVDSKSNNKIADAPICKIYMVQDTTVEALARHLSTQVRGTTIFVDELETVFQSMNRYKKNANDRAHFLTAYNGGSANILRVNSGVTIVENFAFGIIGGIQPGVISKALDTEDGLIERFMPVSMGEAQVGQDINVLVSQNWFDEVICDIVTRLPSVYKLRQDSYDRIRQVEEEGLSLAGRGHALGQVSSGWAGKLLSHLARITIALHSLRDGSEIVSDATVVAAIKILREFVIPHALIFFGEERSVLAKREKALAQYIIAKELNRFVASDIRSNVREFRETGNDRTSSEVVLPAAEKLTTLGWIRPDNAKGDWAAGAKSWVVNPRVHEIYRERASTERQRREMIHKLLRAGA